MSYTTWMHLAITWSDSNNDDEFKAFINGAQTGATSAALNAWAGGGLGTALFGAALAIPFAVWHGWLSDGAVWDTVLTPAQILDLATV